MAACLAALGGTRLAALLLSAGIEPDPQVAELTRAGTTTGLPILVTSDDSYQTATRVRDLDPRLPADDLERAEAMTNSIVDALDASWLDSLLSPARPRRLSLAAFRYRLAELAHAAGAQVVLPEGTEPSTLRAASPVPSGASPAVSCSGRPMRWPGWPAASGCSCPAAPP